MKKHFFFFIAGVLLLAAACSKGSDDGATPITPPPSGNGNTGIDPSKVTLERVTVFNSGSSSSPANAYRIPSLVTAPDGQLLAIGEARWDSWVDKSRTDIVMKVGSIDGKTWSDEVTLTPGGSGAYMDPVAVVDASAQKVFVFTTYWPDKIGQNNKAFCITIEKVGQTWQKTEIKDVSNLFNLPDKSRLIGGFGPGAGLQMSGDKYAGRLIVPVRIFKWDNTTGALANVGLGALYSTNHGATWELGNPASTTGEFQIAECPKNTLIYNMRGAQRYYGRSTNGGMDWSKHAGYSNPDQLPVPDRGCQGSVLGKGSVLYYTGPEGITATSTHDSRGRLVLCQSKDEGISWSQASARILLYEKAAGYSCMTFMKDGRLAVLAEVGDDPGFITAAGTGNKRPAGWMRLDIIIINQN